MSGVNKRPFADNPQKDAELRKLVSNVREEFQGPQSSRASSPRKGANPPRRNALGRGLSALMSSTAVSVERASDASVTESNAVSKNTGEHPLETELPAAVQPPVIQAVPAVSEAPGEGAEPGTNAVRFIPVEEIIPNQNQPRKRFSADEIASLAGSIESSGVLQPILVRALPEEGAFEIVAGERRWRAARKAGLLRVPALVRELTDRETLEVAIIENVQRQNLNPIEEARAYRRLIEDFGESQSEVAKCVGKDRVSVANALRLLKLPETVQEMLLDGRISAGHGRAVLMLEEVEKQIQLADVIFDEGLSVRAAEALAQTGEISKKAERHRAAAKSNTKDAAVMEVEHRIRRALGTKVSMKLGKKGAGELKIAFYSQDELNSLLEKFGA